MRQDDKRQTEVAVMLRELLQTNRFVTELVA